MAQMPSAVDKSALRSKTKPLREVFFTTPMNSPMAFGVSNDAVLRVPKASMELYEQAVWWEDFWRFNAKVGAIEDVVGIEHIETNVPYLQSDAVYDLSGRRLTDVENLKSGIYIVNGKKVVIK